MRTRAAPDRQVLAPQGHERGLKARGAIDDHKFGSFQAAGIKIIEGLPPRGGALPAHIPDGKQHLLTVAAHADGSQDRDVRGFPIQPGLDHGAVEDQADDVLVDQAARAPGVPVYLDLAPDAADHILADGALEQPEQRPLDPARIGSREVDRRDQGLGFLRQPLVAGQRLRPPFLDLARLVLDPGARHPHRLGAEGPGELSFPVPVAIALRRAIPTMVAKAAEEAGELLFEHGFYGRADVAAKSLLDRVEPGLFGQ